MDTVARNRALLPALLPGGFEDLLPPQAEQEYRAIACLLEGFSQFGYARVKPPLAEFEESLLAPGPGEAMIPETFRVMDHLSHRMLALRSDITAQIARIALSRLADAPRPLRLAYANDVIRTRASQQRTRRQYTQVGCEMIGLDSAVSDIEICVVALKGLYDLGLRGLTLDFALPQIVPEILADAEDDIDVLRLRLSGVADKALAALDGLNLSAAVRGHVVRLRTVVAGVQEAVDALGLAGDVSLTVDPLETRGFEYHDGPTFTLFARGVRGELGRGGRYRIYGPEEVQESAAGFTFYMDTIRHGFEYKDLPEIRVVPADAGWGEIVSLQAQGYRVVRDLEGE